ncbi:MAG: ketoacyl-ACP synthase III [Candidatus Eisenbacteria bacterium]|uniref:Beta-ketoacyl-[acyl-carrier-protein] synthase III n=1 Tax=Eiseniibacteriota bacterium TaxID=2212470 RepID=A0A7Y2E5J4_UNCEI|nr:ketoacyl-ACP synthase III [Candidatus Eisenbacteria bacterium]
MRYTRIAGVGHYVPERVVSNHELEKHMETSDEWIVERSGIRERRFAADTETSTDLGLAAAKAALDNAGWKPEDVQFIVYATLSPDMFFPGNGVLLQRDLGIEGVGALDVRNQCSGFIYGLATADGFIRMGMYDRVLLVGAELHSSGLVMTTEGRDTAVLFGDGGGAVCLEVTDDPDGGRLLAHNLHADGRYAEDLAMLAPSAAKRPWFSASMIDEGLTTTKMNGREVFRHAVTRFPQAINEVLEQEGVQASDIDLLIPHQANLRIIDAVKKKMGLSDDKVFANLQKYGNTTAASIPLAFSEAVAEGRAKRGDLICMAAFGSGFTWGASLFRF